MKNRGFLWLLAVLIGSALAFSPIVSSPVNAAEEKKGEEKKKGEDKKKSEGKKGEEKKKGEGKSKKDETK